MAKFLQDQIDLDHEFGKLDVVESDEKLIIALDFGTTFSGISYCFSGTDKPDPQSIEDWPGTEGQNPPKTPTLMNYDPKDGQSFTWGSRVDTLSPGMLEGIKLLLVPSQLQPLFVPAQDAKRILLKLGKPPIDIAADYIGALYKHGLEHIEKTHLRDYVQMHQKKFVLTVPADWSDKAKDATMRVCYFPCFS
jgi:molecular chaperone DnaK (HSP70)